jgi:hypothetical protein
MAKSPFSSDVKETLDLLAKGQRGERAVEIARLLLSNKAPDVVSFILKARQNFGVEQSEALSDIVTAALSDRSEKSISADALIRITESVSRKYEKKRKMEGMTSATVRPSGRQLDSDEVLIYADVLPDESAASPELRVIESLSERREAPQIAEVFKAHGIGEQLRRAFQVVAAYENNRDRVVALTQIAKKTASDKNDINVLFDAYLQLNRAASNTQNPLAELQSIPSGNIDEGFLNVLSRLAR